MILERMIWNKQKKYLTDLQGNAVEAEAVGTPFPLLYDDGLWDYRIKEEFLHITDRRIEHIDEKGIKQIESDILKKIERKGWEDANAYSISEKGYDSYGATLYAVHLFHK
jgi:hypothetical protein